MFWKKKKKEVERPPTTVSEFILGVDDQPAEEIGTVAQYFIDLFDKGTVANEFDGLKFRFSDLTIQFGNLAGRPWFLNKNGVKLPDLFAGLNKTERRAISEAMIRLYQYNRQNNWKEALESTK